MVQLQMIGAASVLALALATGPVQAQSAIGSYKDSLKTTPSPGEIEASLQSLAGALLNNGLANQPKPQPAAQPSAAPQPQPQPQTATSASAAQVLEKIAQMIVQQAVLGTAANAGRPGVQATGQQTGKTGKPKGTEKLEALMQSLAAQQATSAAARTAAMAGSAANRNAQALSDWRRVFAAQYPAYAGSPNWASVPAGLNAHYVGSAIATMPGGETSSGSFEVVFDFTSLYAHGGMTFVSPNPALDGHVSFSGNVLTGSGNALVSDSVSGGAFGGTIIGGDWKGRFYGSAAEMILGDWSAVIDSGPNAGTVYGQAGGVR